MSAEPITVLHMDESEPDRALLAAYFEDAAEGEFTLVQTSGLGEAIRRLEAGGIDVALVHLRAVQSDVAERVRALRRADATVPILVSTGLDDEAFARQAFEAGAQDYLFKNEMNGRTVRRAVGYALARRRETELSQMRRSLEVYARLGSSGAKVPTTARLMGVGPLKARAPRAFAQSVASWSDLLLTYVAAATQRHSAPQAAMERLAAWLGDVNAGPKDVIDVHSAALEQLNAGHGERAQSRLTIEGRLFALEMMGFVLDHYRLGLHGQFAKAAP